MKVAWIGLGHMGLPTAKMVAAAGYQVNAYARRKMRAEQTIGLVMARSPREASQEADLICLAPFSDDQVEDILEGSEGIFPVLKDGAVVAIFTTGSITSAQRLSASAPPGVAVLDTCFSRPPDKMETGKLNLLVGGDADAVERCRAVLATFANDIFHLGPSGNGRAIKLVNNLLWTAHHCVAIDALNLARELGLDPIRAAGIMADCTGSSAALRVYTKPDWPQKVDFMTPYFIKDSRAAADAALDAGVDLGTLGAITKKFSGRG